MGTKFVRYSPIILRMRSTCSPNATSERERGRDISTDTIS